MATGRKRSTSVRGRSSRERRARTGPSATTEERLAASERRLRDAQRVARIGSWEWDIRTGAVTWSDELYRLYGQDPRSFTPSYESYLSLVHPDDRERVKGVIEDARRTRRPFSFDARMLLHDGSTPWFHSTGEVECDRRGEPVAMRGAGQDITERKRAEERLAESEGWLRAIFEAEPECVKLTARDGTLLDINPAGLRMIEADSLDQVRGMNALELVAPEHRRAFGELSRRVFEGRSGELEFEIVGLRGTRRHMETHSVPLRGPGGAVVAALGITRDVTARRRAERLLRERERELRSLTAHLQQVREEERKRMAREIHDVLGQTLTALRLDLDWLSQSLRPGEQTLTRKIADMSALVVSTIRSVRRIATELRPVVLDDLGLAAAIQWQAREFSERTGVDCRLRAPPDDDGLDPEAAATLFRIFQEALTNIARHARATLVETALRRDGKHLVLEVWDNGRGITDAERENPDSLGVVSMRERAMLLGGSLEITGFADRGTRLRVAVPAAARAPA